MTETGVEQKGVFSEPRTQKQGEEHDPVLSLGQSRAQDVPLLGIERGQEDPLFPTRREGGPEEPGANPLSPPVTRHLERCDLVQPLKLLAAPPVLWMREAEEEIAHDLTLNDGDAQLGPCHPGHADQRVADRIRPIGKIPPQVFRNAETLQGVRGGLVVILDRFHWSNRHLISKTPPQGSTSPWRSSIYTL